MLLFKSCARRLAGLPINSAQYITPVCSGVGRWNNYITYMSSGAGSWGEPADTCTPTLYTNAGGGGFIIVTASATQWRSDYYTLGSTYPQCTVGDLPVTSGLITLLYDLFTASAMQ